MNQFRSFLGSVAKFRQGLFGTDTEGELVTIEYDRGAVPGLTGYHTPIREAQRSEEAGQWQQFDAIVRVIKADHPTFAPERNKSVVLNPTAEKPVRLRIESILGSHAVSAEWVLACKADN